MTTIVLVDDDPVVASSVKQTLEEQALDVIVVPSNSDAIEAMHAHPVDVLLVDARHETVNGTSLIEMAQGAQRRVTTILMMASATARETEAALDRGVAGILDKPFTDQDLWRALDQALSGESFRGRLSGISLLDLFQVFNLSRRSLVVRVGGVPPAKVWFENGEIVHAECGDEMGETVLERLVDVRTGAIQTLPFAPAPRTIDRLFHGLLLNILRAQDESHKSDDEPDDETWELSDADFVEADDGTFESTPINEVESVWSIPRPVIETILAPSPDEPEPPSPEDELMWSARTVLPQRKLDPICRALTAELPSALAASLIDLTSGQVLGLHNTAQFTPAFERFIALYVRELFRGPEIQHIERSVQEQRGLEPRVGFLEEVVLTSRHTHHLTKALKGGEVALMVVTPRRVRVETTWSHLRTLIPGVETNLD